MATTATTNRILIVEDDASIRGLMSRHFRRHGFEVEQAGGAEEALSRIASTKSRFDVVLTDIHLPGASGVELARELQEARPGQPVVFMTGDADADMARTALEGGAAGYLLKPFEFFELDAVVNQAVQRRFAMVAERGVRVDAKAVHVTKPARVVLSPRARTRQRLASRLRVAFASAAFVAAAFVAGAGVAPAPVSVAQAVEAREAADRPVVVPVVIERNIYRK